MIRNILQTYRVSFTGLSRETWLLSMVILINRCGYMAVPFMSMYITQSLHRSIADAGLIITLFGVGSVMGAMAGGYLSDRIGFHQVQVVSLVISGLLFVLFGHVDDFNALCLLTILLSFFVEAFKPANNSAIAAYSSRENLTRSYALNRLATNIGFGFGTSVGGLLAAINYHLLFWVDGVIYVIAGLMIAFFLPSARQQISSLKAAKTAGAAKSPWKDVFFVRFIFLVSLYMLTFVLIFRIVPVYWKQELGIGEATIGILLGMNGVIIAFFEMVLIQKLAGRKPDYYYIVAGILFTAGSFLCLIIPVFNPIVIGAFTVFLFTIGEMLTLPYMSTLVVNRSTVHNRGQYSAAYSLSWAVAQVIGPASGGYIAEHWGYNSLWMVLVVISVVSAMGFRYLFQNELQPDR